MLKLLVQFHTVTVPLGVAVWLAFKFVRHPDLLSLGRLHGNGIPFFNKNESDNDKADDDIRRAA